MGETQRLSFRVRAQNAGGGFSGSLCGDSLPHESEPSLVNSHVDHARDTVAKTVWIGAQLSLELDFLLHT